MSETVEPSAEAAASDPKPVEAPIAEPQDVLDLPENDPLKTMYVSDTEMRDALGAEAPAAEEPVIEMPPIEDEPAASEPPPIEEYAAPEPPSFNVPDVPAPSFGDMATPPSPFSMSDSVPEEPALCSACI